LLKTETLFENTPKIETIGEAMPRIMLYKICIIILLQK